MVPVYTAPAAMTAGSFEKIPMILSGMSTQILPIRMLRLIPETREL